MKQQLEDLKDQKDRLLVNPNTSGTLNIKLVYEQCVNSLLPVKIASILKKRVSTMRTLDKASDAGFPMPASVGSESAAAAAPSPPVLYPTAKRAHDAGRQHAVIPLFVMPPSGREEPLSRTAALAQEFGGLMATSPTPPVPSLFSGVPGYSYISPPFASMSSMTMAAAAAASFSSGGRVTSPISLRSLDLSTNSVSDLVGASGLLALSRIAPDAGCVLSDLSAHSNRRGRSYTTPAAPPRCALDLLSAMPADEQVPRMKIHHPAP
jgi:hypothetical protein